LPGNDSKREKGGEKMNDLATATQNVAFAEAGLLSARREADDLRRKASHDEAEKIRARLTLLKPALEELIVTVKVTTNQRLDFHYKIVNARAQVADWSAAPEDLFTSQRELTDRKRQAGLWTKRLNELTLIYADAAQREGDSRRQALEMAAEYRALLCSYNNYVSIAEGGEPGFPLFKGGLSAADNFLITPGSLEDYPAVTVSAPGPKRILDDGSDAKDTRSTWERLC
jgi:hypothetical protein